MQALQAATRNPASFFGKLRTQGTVEEGKLADLVILNANPLDDIRNTQNIAVVIANGNVLNRAKLDEMLASVAHAAGTIRAVRTSR
jgi:imidazolonepropionase-like amidohydrolase